MYRAQGRKEQLRIFDRLPLDIEYLIQQYEAMDVKEEEHA